MPEVSGVEFYNIVKKKWPILKDRIIFFIDDFLGDAATFIVSVPNKCIKKPFNLGELKETIGTL